MFSESRISSAFKKYSNFRLACAKGETVATAPNSHNFDPLGAHFPRFLGNSPGFSIDPLTHWVRSISAHFPRPKYPDTLTHWVQVVRESPHPLGAGLLGCLCWVRGCGGARESLERGEGVGPAGSMVRLRRHHRNCENFLENQKPNGFTYSIAPTLHNTTRM